MDISPDKSYSIIEAADTLDVVTATVGRYIREKKLKATKIRIKGLRQEWRIRGSEIISFLKK